MKYMRIGADKSRKPRINLQTRDQSDLNSFCLIAMMRIYKQNPIMNPIKVYLIQNNAPVMMPQIRASVFEGRELPFTIAFNAK